VTRWSTRRAGRADAETMLQTMAIGFEGYRAFAPPGWRPPDDIAELARLRDRLGDPGTWALIAEESEQAAGHVGFLPQPATEGSAHLWQLFIRPAWWGTGLAGELLARAIEEARAQGYERMRLFTPDGQARARAFYEREGFEAVGPPAFDPKIGFEVVQYARGL